MFKCENCGTLYCEERYKAQFCEDCKKYPECKFICVCPAGELVNYDEHCFEPKEETVESKERQIEEIKQVVGLNCDRQGFAKHCPERISSGIYTAGYRRADEVIDEFVERLKEENEINFRRYGKGIGMYDIHLIADKMKLELFIQQEVDKNVKDI